MEHECLLSCTRCWSDLACGQRLPTRIRGGIDAKRSASVTGGGDCGKADTPMGAMAQALYAQFVEDEDGLGKDFSAMLPKFEKSERP